MASTGQGTVITLTLTLATALALTACQGDGATVPSLAPSTVGQASTPPTNGIEFTTEVLLDVSPVPATVDLTAIGAQDPIAAGILLDERTVKWTDTGGKLTGISGVMDDGTVVAVRSTSTASGPGQDNLSQSTVGIIDTSGAFLPFPTVDLRSLEAKGVDGSIARQAGSFDTRGSEVTWAETSSTEVVSDNWVIFAHDLTTGVTTVLGSSNELLPNGHLPGMGPEVSPTIGSSRVYWGTTYPRGEKDGDGNYNDFGFEVLAAPLGGSRTPAVIADGAILPAADGDCVAFARVWGYDESVPRGEIRLARICGDGPETPLARLHVGPDGSIGNLVADAGRVAWSTHSRAGQGKVRGEVAVLDTTTGALTTVSLSADPATATAFVAQMSLDGDLLQWTTDKTRTVLDLSDNSLWSLPSSEGYYGVYHADGWVGWALPSANSLAPGTVTLARWNR